MSRFPSLPGRPAYLSPLPDFLFREDEWAPRYVVKAWLLSFAGTVLLSLLATPTLPAEGWPEIRVTGGWAIVLLVLVAPAFETLLMVPPLLLLDRLLGAGPAVVGNAIVWGVLHSLSAPNWGLIIWWPFLIMSVAYLTWRPAGFARAFLVVAGIHALQNGIAVANLLLTA